MECVISWHLIYIWNSEIQKNIAKTDHFYLVKMSGYNKKNKYKIEYPCLSSTICLVSHLAEISQPVFIQIHSLEDQVHDEELSNSNDVNFDTEDASVRKGFVAWVEWFITRFGIIKKKSFRTRIKTEWDKLVWKRRLVILLLIQWKWISAVFSKYL